MDQYYFNDFILLAADELLVVATNNEANIVKAVHEQFGKAKLCTHIKPEK